MDMNLFCLEMVSSIVERGLLVALHNNPEDKAARNAYIDYLIENGRPIAAEAVREGFTPGKGYNWRAPGAIACGSICSGVVSSDMSTPVQISSGSFCNFAGYCS